MTNARIHALTANGYLVNLAAFALIAILSTVLILLVQMIVVSFLKVKRMKVKCIDNSSTQRLTIDKIYSVEYTTDAVYIIKDDMRESMVYFKSRFEEVKEMEQQYQEITMDNLAETLIFNGAVDQSTTSTWHYYYNLSDSKIFWDSGIDSISIISSSNWRLAQTILKTNLDLFLIALERRGIKLNPLPVKPEFNFKQYLLDSGMFRERSEIILSHDTEVKDNFINLDTIKHTKENADKLIQIAQLFKKVK